MLHNCPSCGTPLPSPEVKVERKFVELPNWQAFRDTCMSLLASPSCTDEKFRSALTDFPQALSRYQRLTEGQWKFFCVIYKSISGTWPKTADFASAAKAPENATPGYLDDIPF